MSHNISKPSGKVNTKTKDKVKEEAQVILRWGGDVYLLFGQSEAAQSNASSTGCL